MRVYTQKYGVSTKDQKEYDRVRGLAYRDSHKPASLAYQYKYRRSVMGLVTLSYSHMKMSSVIRGHKPPSFSKKELLVWISKNPQDAAFKRLFKDWSSCNYQKKLKPSFDRLNNHVGYSLDNLRVVTWLENSEAGFASRRKAVVCMTKEGKFLRCYKGLLEASKSILKSRKAIGNAIKRGQCSGGFRWEYGQ